MKHVFLTLMIVLIATQLFAQDDNDGIGKRPNPPCSTCDQLFMRLLGGNQVSRPYRTNPIALIGVGKNKNSYTQEIGLKYTQSTFIKNAQNFEYKTISLPVLIQRNINPYISIGGGAEANYLLSAKINTKAVSKVDTKQFGFGVFADAEVGFQNRGPRLGISYTHRINSGVVNSSNYGFLDLTLRVQIWDKKKVK